MSSYCDYAPTDPIHASYHAEEYGFPIRDDRRLFERLILEINQAGLSWATVLRKRDGFRRAYADFDVDTVAAFEDEDRARLLADPGIIRNRLKVNAAVTNARRIIEIRSTHGSFAEWLDHHHPIPREEWVKVFRRNFVFVGGEIVGEFLMSTGYLPGAHRPDCPVFERIRATNPPWLQV